jgi:hypothetical protein
MGLDEASARGFTVSEVGAEGVVEWLAVENPMSECVLLYEGEELIGAKQNRIVQETILVGAHSMLKIPAKCVERGRWARHSQHFRPAPRAAYPELRKARRQGLPVASALVTTWRKSHRSSLKFWPSGDKPLLMWNARRSTPSPWFPALPGLAGAC